ncbi:MAG TPA: hypothetical protein VIM12_03470 [Noviherbaspirillum sp.]|jgi:hypothetical protein|uniref:hypothetical protein n=1 Tax=Noviherbaspirillum sp. TaxID=1926288 RepID=UPI002F91F950
MPNRTLRIDLAHPAAVDGRPAPFQSLWLLLRLYQARQRGMPAVPAAALQARFPGNANLRMLVSRAYRDFGRWGIGAGWGHRQDVPVALLNPRGRSQGPFWITAADAQRLRIRLHGRPADDAALAHFLGGDAATPMRNDPVGHAMQDVTYWNHLTQAMRVAQDGVAPAAGAAVADSFGAAAQTARGGFQSALALLKESLAWRRHGSLRRSGEALDRLARYLVPEAGAAATRMPTLAAMAHVARAWNCYSRDDAVAAHAELDRLANDPALQPALQYNPRVRFETLNLRALLYRGTALGTGPADRAVRAEAATQAMAALSEALEAAYEADSIDAAQDVAANIGWTLWLCWQQCLLDPARAREEAAVQAQALRWLGLSEWICDRFGVGGNSAWNTVFVLRIVRGHCRWRQDGGIDAFRAQQPLSIHQLLDATRPFHAPFSRAKGYTRWSAVAAFALDEHDAGRSSFGPLQVANLLLEAAWFLAWEDGICKEASAAADRLARMLPSLQPGERRFFRAGLRSLPEPLASSALELSRGGGRRPPPARPRSTSRQG